jgi:hypothetical protein
MRDVLLDAPFLQVALALTLVVMAAALLYRIDKGNRHLHPGLRAGLGVLRALSGATLVLLLFRPVLRFEESHTHQPSLIVLQDLSASVGAEDPDWSNRLNAWMASLPSEEGQPGASIKKYGFGSGLVALDAGDTLKFTDPTTDLSTALDIVQGQWAGAPVGAIVIATDGRFNRGKNPEGETRRLPAPLHVITLGDTSLRKDLRILRLLHNDVAGLGNQFPIEAELAGQGYRGTVTVRITGPDTDERKEVTFDGSGIPKTVRFLVEAARPGIQRYRITLDTVEGEENKDNNRRTALIDVIEGRKRILMVGPAPHPDLGAWTNALSSNLNYEVKSIRLSELTQATTDDAWDAAYLFSFDPDNPEAAAALRNCKDAGISTGIILDPLARFDALPGLGLGVSLTTTRQGLTTDPRGAINPAFPHFQLEEGMSQWLAEAPPLMSPFVTAEWGPAHTPLLFQRIGGITTEQPLLTVTQTNSERGLFLLGEGSWRWRQVGYLRTGSHDLFNDLVGKLTQFLTSDPGVNRFRVEAPRLLDEDQRLQWQARTYDATLQPFEGADIAMELSDSAGTRYNYRFSSAAAGGYALDAGRWPRGTYTWRASTKIGDKAFERSGIIEVRPMELERNGRPADHAILQRMAIATQGTAVSPDSLDVLTATLKASTRFTPERDISERLRDIIEWKTLALILLGLLCSEWIIRRWAGTY